MHSTVRRRHGRPVLVCRLQIPAADAVRSLSTAASVLTEWKVRYNKTREDLASSVNRWEFNRSRLFDATDYMAAICEDLRFMVVVVDDFAKFLGPELKAVTGNAEVRHGALRTGRGAPQRFAALQHVDARGRVSRKPVKSA